MDTIGKLSAVRLNTYKPSGLKDPDLLDMFLTRGWGEFSQFAYDAYEKHLKNLIKEVKYYGTHKNRG